MERLKRAAISPITYPMRQYRKFKDYRHQRINDAPLTWNLSSWERLHPSLRQGYKFCLGIVASIWVLVLAFIIWAGVVHEAQAGLILTLKTGSCAAAQDINFWVHLVVNGLASILYAVSSFVMQRIAAPSREDIDRAHGAEKPMKIGSLAFANFAVLSGKRLGVFFLLWASSLPLHLLFNSVVVYTSTNAEWPSYVFLLSEEQFESLMSNTSALAVSGVRQYDGMPGEVAIQAQAIIHQQPPMVDLRLEECIDTFGSGSSETWGDVVLVYSSQSRDLPGFRRNLKKPTFSLSSYLPFSHEDPWRWMCGYNDGNATCDAQKILDSGRWVADGLTVSRCLARRLPELCELNMSLAILIAVLVAVSIKLIAIVFAVVLGRDRSLLTIGDAIASFLEDPDKYVWPRSRSSYQSRRRMVMFEMKGAFWAATIFGIIVLSLAWWFFVFTFRETSIAFSLSKTPFDFDTMLRYGLGKMPSRWSSTLNSNLLSYPGAENPYFTYTNGAVLANLPQLALSAFYLVFNNYLTRLFVALEFRGFSTRRRGLRVSKPMEGTKQRRAHFLQIPLRYSLLSMGLFVLLHTFLSQSLFLRRVYAVFPRSYDDPGEIGKKLLPMIGYSPVAAFAFAILFTSLILSGLIIGLIPLDWRLLDTSGDSFEIGITCLPSEEMRKTHEGAIRWGVTNKYADGSIKCSFSLLPVRPPDPGEVMNFRTKAS
ncbi:hypothetical protein NUW58_g3445 [Xylaria curta]|uniref:Uncharacterized protein n=1 Tax=Xylaria curta TaxID=42375 RepID=A0ACC1PB02_9PEZI|nr:hypothetical protein NUW58_g3445 [Xylaria curta]